MEKYKQPTGKKVLAIISIFLGIAAIPLFFVYYSGLLVGMLGILLAVISSDKSKEKGYSTLSAAALLINVFAVAGNFVMLLLVRYILTSTSSAENATEIVTELTTKSGNIITFLS